MNVLQIFLTLLGPIYMLIFSTLQMTGAIHASSNEIIINGFISLALFVVVNFAQTIYYYKKNKLVVGQAKLDDAADIVKYSWRKMKQENDDLRERVLELSDLNQRLLQERAELQADLEHNCYTFRGEDEEGEDFEPEM